MFDMALDLTGGRSGLQALAEAMQRWTSHLLSTEVTIEPLTELQDAKLTWYVGLDAEATRIGDALWNVGAMADADAARIVGLFRLTFHDDAVVAEAVKGEPVYLLLAMTADKLVRMKPQNLLTGLPVKQREVAS